MKDLARALSVVSIRVVETIPGKSCMALELPNRSVRSCGWSRSVVDDVNDAPGRLTLALGKDIAGRTVVMDLAANAASAGRRTTAG